ncbi:hypothetical protein RRF57_003467 [Xylaria bambusicola]|uniref:Uncharacterized protein n=1 Tax=Xylaria bambusicola TaxID=326684 RepID=A0AAN7Z2U2_9PEZI
MDGYKNLDKNTLAFYAESDLGKCAFQKASSKILQGVEKGEFVLCLLAILCYQKLLPSSEVNGEPLRGNYMEDFGHMLHSSEDIDGREVSGRMASSLVRVLGIKDCEAFSLGQEVVPNCGLHILDELTDE